MKYKENAKSLLIGLLCLSIAFMMGGFANAFSGGSVNVEGDFIEAKGCGGEELVGGLFHTRMEDFAEGISVDGTTIIDADGNIEGAITSSTGTFSSTLTVTGASTFERVTEGGALLATSSAEATTMLETDMITYSGYEMTPTGSVTLTLMATSTMTSLIPNSGDTILFAIYNEAVAGVATTTVAAGTGITLLEATDGDAVITGGNLAEMSCQRKIDTDVTCTIDSNVP